MLIWVVSIPTSKLQAPAKWAKCGQVVDWGRWEDIDYGGTTELKQHQERAKDWGYSANLIASEKRWDCKWALKHGAVVGAGRKTYHKQDLSVSSHRGVRDQGRGTEPGSTAVRVGWVMMVIMLNSSNRGTRRLVTDLMQHFFSRGLNFFVQCDSL